ncbi:MAG: hypothetical protein EBZ49_04910 [Proteobacteria bacterium]|nr:hypothetical protein [Pseudomonadota bacterium]
MKTCKRCGREFCCPENYTKCVLITGKICCYCQEEQFQEWEEETKYERYLNSSEGFEYIFGSKQ